MNLIEFIEMHPGVDNARQLAKMAYESKSCRDELWQLTSHEKNYVSRLAAWALEHCFIQEAEPDLKPELAAVIEDQLPKGTPGFKNAGQKILKKLYREIA